MNFNFSNLNLIVLITTLISFNNVFAASNNSSFYNGKPFKSIDQRINEAEKLGFEILVVSEAAKISFVPKKLKIISYSRIEELIKNLFKGQD